MKKAIPENINNAFLSRWKIFDTKSLKEGIRSKKINALKLKIKIENFFISIGIKSWNGKRKDNNRITLSV